MIEKIRFFIAKQINRLPPMWAMGYYSFRDMFIDGEWKWKTCSEENGYYCGKCEALKRRRLYEK